MAIKDMLVYIDNDEACDSRLRAVASLCRSFQARISGLYFLRSIRIPSYPEVYLPESAIEILKSRVEEQRESAENIFRNALIKESFETEFHYSDDDMSQQMSRQSRYADLLVLAHQEFSDTGLNTDYEVNEMLLGAACPVLVMPKLQGSISLPPLRPLIAWDGSHQSARAVILALPILMLNAEVDIVSVSSDAAGLNKIAEHLERHGIKVDKYLLAGRNFDAASLILEQADRAGNDLIVMGAYGHSRFREEVLGGATKYMLKHAPVPLLFAH